MALRLRSTVPDSAKGAPARTRLPARCPRARRGRSRSAPTGHVGSGARERRSRRARRPARSIRARSATAPVGGTPPISQASAHRAHQPTSEIRLSQLTSCGRPSASGVHDPVASGGDSCGLGVEVGRARAPRLRASRVRECLASEVYRSLCASRTLVSRGPRTPPTMPAARSHTCWMARESLGWIAAAGWIRATEFRCYSPSQE